jgi:hypothetical protein
MIDRAINASGGKIWSIKNSHAIILFRANINHSNHPNAKQSLKKSMDILTECYNWDKRKPFHALTFAGQALQYWEVYGDEEAFGYLQTAKKWLVSEEQRSFWNRNIKRLLTRIDRALRTK